LKSDERFIFNDENFELRHFIPSASKKYVERIKILSGSLHLYIGGPGRTEIASLRDAMTSGSNQFIVC
jgi:hypothetical protein